MLNYIHVHASPTFMVLQVPLPLRLEVLGSGKYAQGGECLPRRFSTKYSSTFWRLFDMWKGPTMNFHFIKTLGVKHRCTHRAQYCEYL